MIGLARCIYGNMLKVALRSSYLGSVVIDKVGSGSLPISLVILFLPDIVCPIVQKNTIFCSFCFSDY